MRTTNFWVLDPPILCRRSGHFCVGRKCRHKPHKWHKRHKAKMYRHKLHKRHKTVLWYVAQWYIELKECNSFGTGFESQSGLHCSHELEQCFFRDTYFLKYGMYFALEGCTISIWAVDDLFSIQRPDLESSCETGEMFLKKVLQVKH